MSRAGGRAGKLRAPKLCQSVSTSGPRPPVKPMPTKTSSSSSIAWVTRWRWPSRRPGGTSVRSRRSARTARWAWPSPPSPLGQRRFDGLGGRVEHLAHRARPRRRGRPGACAATRQRGPSCRAPRSRTPPSSSRLARRRMPGRRPRCGDAAIRRRPRRPCRRRGRVGHVALHPAAPGGVSSSRLPLGWCPAGRRRWRSASKQMTVPAIPTLSDSVRPAIGMVTSASSSASSSAGRPCASLPSTSATGPARSTAS